MNGFDIIISYIKGFVEPIGIIFKPITIVIAIIAVVLYWIISKIIKRA